MDGEGGASRAGAGAAGGEVRQERGRLKRGTMANPRLNTARSRAIQCETMWGSGGSIASMAGRLPAPAGRRRPLSWPGGSACGTRAHARGYGAVSRAKTRPGDDPRHAIGSTAPPAEQRAGGYQDFGLAGVDFVRRDRARPEVVPSPRARPSHSSTRPGHPSPAGSSVSVTPRWLVRSSERRSSMRAPAPLSRAREPSNHGYPSIAVSRSPTRRRQQVFFL